MALLGVRGLFPKSLRVRVLLLTLLALATIAAPAAITFVWIVDKAVVKIGTLFAENQILFDRYRGLESLMREVSLAETAARSPAVIAWAREEENAGKRERGIAELEHYRTAFKDQSYFAVLSASGNYYYNNEDNEYAGRQLRYRVSPENPRDGWFFKTVALEQGCHLNVDHDDVLQVTKVWVNCVIRDDGEVLGAVGTGVDLSSFIRDVVDIPQTGVQSMFVDLNGAVQAHRNPDSIDYHSITKDTKNKNTIFGMIDSEADRTRLRAMMDEITTGDVLVRSAFMTLDGKKYLVGIGYLNRLGWFNVTLMDIDTIVDRRLFLPLGLLLAGVLIAAALLMTFLFKRAVLDRLARLEHDVRTVEAGDFAGVRQDDSPDEIGRLSRTLGHMAEVVGEKTHVLEGMVRERTEKLERLAHLDPMTEIWNRRGFADAFSKEQSRAARTGRHCGLLLVDMDRFKSINDTYGHQAGDEAIIEVAGRISAALRDYDICARWGGDEFIVLASDVNKTSLAIMASKLLIAVNHEPMTLSGGTSLDISVSIGGCMVTPDDMLLDATARADAALYETKRRQRNGYMISGAHAGPPASSKAADAKA